MQFRKQGVCCVLLAWMAGISQAAVYMVTNSAAVGPGTLAQAVINANSDALPDVIQFDLPGPVPVVINPGINLIVTSPVLIDGTTQPGYVTNIPAVWVVNTGTFNNAINLSTTNATVRGLHLAGYEANGVYISGDSNRVEACVITANDTGIAIIAGRVNMIGGPAASNLNVVSGNILYGVSIVGPNAANNVVMGNWIGVSATNSATPQGNGLIGISISSSHGNAIVGTGAVRQVISGNLQDGIVLTGSAASNTLVQGNHIGVDATGLIAVSNKAYGIYSGGSPGLRVGGTNAIDRNVISGNGGDGVHLNSSGAAGAVIEGNYIGVNATASAALPNGSSGIRFQGAGNGRVGGASAGQGNIIGGNKSAGINITSGVGGLIQGNYIGMNAAGTTISNHNSGVVLSATDWLVGGSNAASRNVIGGNQSYGVFLNFANGCRVAGNFIGIDAGGAAKANTLDGIYLSGSVNCEIGGTTTNEANLICGNLGSGINISIGSSNTIRGNLIGVFASGVAVSNTSYGIRLGVTTGIVVGGSSPGERNVISGNGNDNIHILADSAGAWIKGNFIGLNPAGTAAAVTGSTYGIFTRGSGHMIGGTNSGEGNVISGNGQAGVFLQGVGIQVAGNLIGLASNGLAVVSNRMDGIVIGATTNCIIGGTTPAARNVIAGHTDGIDFSSTEAQLNTIIGNYLGLGVNGTSIVRNTSSDIALSLGGRNNRIGGYTTAERNVLSGTFRISNPNATGNVVVGNFVGVDALSRLVTNTSIGVEFQAGSGNTIGGSAEGAANVIGGRTTGIRIQGATITGTRIEGNRIGIGTNDQPLGVFSTAAEGINIALTSGNTIGGTNPAAGNTIGYYQKGIVVVSSNRNAILGNLVVSNTSLAIDLGGDGLIEGQDPLDADTGANDRQNAPTLTNALSFLGSTFVQGYLPSKASSTYRIEFFTSLNNVQMSRFLGFAITNTSATGTGTFSVVLSGYVPTGLVVRATATDTNGNTSELGGSATVVLATDTDNDKMPNFWETQYGLNPSISNSVTSDLDGDLIPDIAEYIAGTLPNDPNSTFELVAIDPAAPGQAVSFASVHTRVYDVQATTNLLTGPWNNIVTNLPGNGNVKTFTDVNDGVTNLYRAMVRIPPR